MLKHFITAQLGDAIETEVVFLGVDFSDKFTLKGFELGAVDLAFENRFLYPLPDAFTTFGNPAQAPTAFSRFSIDVIADDDQHQRTVNGK